jgi:transcriptional regulator with XRE-family HTH domain
MIFLKKIDLRIMADKKIEKIKIEFGLKVKELRQTQNLTQLDLAAKVGIDIRSLRRIENGESEASLSTIYFIANALNVSTSDLFDF